MPRGIYERSEETKERCRTLNLGNKHTEETKLKISKKTKGKNNPRCGIKVSLETRRRMSNKAKGKIPWNLGKQMNIKTKDKIRQKALGRKMSEETKKKLSKANKGRFVSKECRIKIGNAHRGEKNSNWKGGVTPYNIKVRRSFKYQEWRKKVYERDNYVCQFCHKKSEGDLQAHHIMPFREYKKLWFKLDNGLTLCKKCHEKTINNESNFEVFCKWIIQLKNQVSS